MQEFYKGKTMIEGIVSFRRGSNCFSQFFPTHFTRVRHYLTWIERKRKLPTNCGHMAKHSVTRIAGGNTESRDEYSWEAILVYGERINRICTGVVIISLYVLTSVYCTHGVLIEKSNDLRISKFCYKTYLLSFVHRTGVQLRECDGNADYRTKYSIFSQEFRIEQITDNGSFLDPKCLPFGSNPIPKPTANTRWTFSGWQINMNHISRFSTRRIRVRQK